MIRVMTTVLILVCVWSFLEFRLILLLGAESIRFCIIRSAFVVVVCVKLVQRFGLTLLTIVMVLRFHILLTGWHLTLGVDHACLAGGSTGFGHLRWIRFIIPANGPHGTPGVLIDAGRSRRFWMGRYGATLDVMQE